MINSIIYLQNIRFNSINWKVFSIILSPYTISLNNKFFKGKFSKACKESISSLNRVSPEYDIKMINSPSYDSAESRSNAYNI